MDSWSMFYYNCQQIWFDRDMGISARSMAEHSNLRVWAYQDMVLLSPHGWAQWHHLPFNKTLLAMK